MVEQLLRDAADPLDHLRGVAAVLPAQALEHAVRIAKRRVLLRIAVGVQLELPRGLVVAPDGGVESAEEPIQVRRGLELGVEDQGGVRVRHDVIVEVFLALDRVVDQAAEEHDVGARSDRHPDVRDRKSTRLNSSHLVISYAVFCLKKKNLMYKRRVVHGTVGLTYCVICLPACVK